MKRILYALSITASFWVFMGVSPQINYAAEGANTENMQEGETTPLSVNKKILIAYFSHTGNTREIANQIRQRVGGDIVEIRSVEPYPDDYNAVVGQAKEELDSGYKPALETKVDDIQSYDVIFIGYPNWWNTFPAPVKTFLTEYDLTGKTIVPFCTHGGSGLGQSVADISTLCPKATVLEGIAISGSSVKTAQDKVSDWLKKIKVAK